MEADTSSLAIQLLPRQRNNVITKPTHANAANFYSNIFEIKLKKGNGSAVHQYVFDISPQLPQDSDGLIERIAKSIQQDLKKNIGLICYRGLMAWGRKEMKTVLSCKAEFTKNDQKMSYDVLIKPTKSIGLESFMKENMDQLPAISQVLNISSKQALRKDGMIELYPGSYYHKDTINMNKTQGKLSVWRGFNVTVTVYNKKLCLQVDPCSRVLRDQSFLETLDQDKKKCSLEELNLKYQGHPILRKYGSPKIYRIQEIDYKLSPKNVFYDSKEGKDVSYLDYYQKVYGVKIRNPSQPLIKVPAERRYNKSSAEEDKTFIYLVPQLLCLTGLTDEQRSNFKVMKSLGEYTKLSANTRMQETQKMIKTIQKDQDLMFDIDKIPKALQGFKLSTPQIMLGPNRKAIVKDGNIMLKEKVLDPFEFKDFVFCYSVDDGKYDIADADEAFELLKEAAKTFGIKFNEPIYLEIKGGRQLGNWISTLEQEKENMGKDDRNDIMFFLLKPNEQKFYGELKKLVSMQFNCASQMARRKLLSRDNKGALSAASKIVMQMNVKNGHALWKVPNVHQVWKNNSVAVAGLASSKGKNGTVLAFNGTINKDLNGFYSDCKKIKGRQSFSAALFSGFYNLWLQNWFMKNEKTLPKVLVVYREGLNEAQARFQAEVEIQGLKDTLVFVREKTKQPNYNPTIVYILVNKKPNSRIFKKQNAGYMNPEAGSVIFEDLSQGYKEFHLASANVREGTTTPVSFKIAYETDPDFPLDAISELTYNQSYCYFNWTGSVRVPATLQNSNKLAKLYSEIGDELRTESKNSDLKSKLFYL